MKDIFYKVCHRHRQTRKLHSCYRLGGAVTITDDPWVLEYGVGLRTVPNYGGIYAFRNFRDAQDFRDEHDGVILCGVGEPLNIPPFLIAEIIYGANYQTLVENFNLEHQFDNILELKESFSRYIWQHPDLIATHRSTNDVLQYTTLLQWFEGTSIALE